MNRGSKLLLVFAVAGCPISNAAGNGGISRSRGVGPEFAKFYTDVSTFSCISNPSIQIPFSAVNDDFCDCPDGSDEPGTSACSYISPLSSSFLSDPGEEGVNRTPALPGFYCKNKGHQPIYIPFQRVNDGVCDYDVCCDGSDEWAHVGGLKCEDRCKDIGKQRRKEIEEKQKSHHAALRNRRELVNKSSKLKKEIEDQIAILESELQTLESKVQILQTDLDEARSRNRGKAVSGKKQLVKELAGVSKAKIEDLGRGLESVRHQRDAHLARLKELEAMLSKFAEEYNPNFNDEGVKRAVRGWEEYAARKSEEDVENMVDDQYIDEILDPKSETSSIDWEKWENGEEEHIEISLAYKIAKLLPSSLLNSIEDKVADLQSWLISNGVIADTRQDSDSGETPEVKEARNRLSSVQSSLDETKSQLKNHRSDLSLDFGPDSVFRAMKGECISEDSGEYTYELCWMEETKQKSKKGRGNTTMGRFVSIGSMMVDEASDSGNVVTKEKLTLEYENGQTCWNGPSRSTKVILDCGENNEILKVAEDEKCIYSMYVTTPAVCEDPHSDKPAKDTKDEL